MNEIERIAATLEIHALKARYFRCLDKRDWEGYAGVFADDVEVDLSATALLLEPGSKEDPWQSPQRATNRVFKGVEAYIAFVTKLLEGVRSVHHGHMPEIEFLSATTAKGIWAMEDLLDFPPGAEFEGTPIHHIHGFGHYWETYEKINGAWKIKTMKISRLRELRH